MDIEVRKVVLPDELDMIRPLLAIVNGRQEVEEALGEFARCRENIYVATVSKRVAGFVSLSYPYWDRVGVIEHIAVEPEVRRAKVGSSLIAFIEGLARKEHLRILCVQTASWNTASRAFYEAQGFKERSILSEYMGPKNDLVWLDKTLE